MTAEPFGVPEVGSQIGWRLSEQDKKDLRLLMLAYRETSPTKLLRALVQQEAAPVRERWSAVATRIAQEEDEREAEAAAP